MGFALRAAQRGERALGVKTLTNIVKGASLLQISDDHDGETYRTVYTVKFPKAVYALHAFQKKSKSGIATPPADINVIKTRLKRAAEHYKDTYETEKKNG